jgi:glycerophosphoryl diester phosphodiesterase
VAPENTIAAFEAALRIPGCDGVEFDVRAAADGVPVVLHDADLRRVQGVDAIAGSLRAVELGKHGVPSLADVLAAVGDRSFLDVELKAWVPGAIDVLGAAREKDGALHRAVVSSFNVSVLENVRSRRPGWPTWLTSVNLADTTIEQAVALGCRGIAALWHSIDERAAGIVRAAGLELAGWTVRRRPTYRRLERLGVVAICAEGSALDG